MPPRFSPSIAGAITPWVELDYGARYAATATSIRERGSVQSALRCHARPREGHPPFHARPSAHGGAGGRGVPAARNHRTGASPRAHVLAAGGDRTCESSAPAASTSLSSTISATLMSSGSAVSTRTSTTSWSRCSGSSPEGEPESLGHYYVAMPDRSMPRAGRSAQHAATGESACEPIDYSVSRAQLAQSRTRISAIACAGPRSPRDRRHPRHHRPRCTPTFRKLRRGSIVLYQLNYGLHPLRSRPRARARRPLRRPGQSGIAVRCRRHEVGSARRCRNLFRDPSIRRRSTTNCSWFVRRSASSAVPRPVLTSSMDPRLRARFELDLIAIHRLEQLRSGAWRFPVSRVPESALKSLDK